MKLISLIHLVIIARSSVSLPLVEGGLSILNQEDDKNLDTDRSTVFKNSNQNLSSQAQINYEKSKSYDSTSADKDTSKSEQKEDDRTYYKESNPNNIVQTKNDTLKTKVHRRKSVENANSKIIQSDVTDIENNSKIRMCVHKFNVAQMDGVTDGSLSPSNADYDESEYEEYGNKNIIDFSHFIFSNVTNKKYKHFRKQRTCITQRHHSGCWKC